jgi:hypothetical protein
MKVHFQKTILSAIAIVIYLASYGQANYAPSGTSTNLCPKTVTYRYTSRVSTSGVSCIEYGWGVVNGTILAGGTNIDGTHWADVVWANATTGSIGNFCGVLNVTINGIARPTISGPSTVLLCGTGSITLQATVSTLSNITGYKWSINGTGISPTGIVNTTGPQLTLNYTNWTVSTAYSATVAVGSVFASCGISTDISPLESFEGISAIPRSAWVQLSRGNIDNLIIPYNFSCPAICSNGTISISNQPSGSNLVWSSSDPSKLSVDANNGFLIRNDYSYNGLVNINATVSNACGSYTVSNKVAVGSPAPSYISIDASTCPEYYFDASYIPNTTSYFWQWSKDPYGTIRTKTTPSSSSGRITLVDGSGNYRIGVKATNACGQSGFTVQTFTVNCGGGVRRAISVSPNPASSTLTIETTPANAVSSTSTLATGLEASTKEAAEIAYTAQLVNAQGTVLKSGTSKEGRIDLDVNDVPMGTYFLHVNNGIETVKSQIVIKH